MEREHTVEEAMDALEEGDAPIEVSAARGALQSRDFRRVWFGVIASGVGTWMQTLTLGAFAWDQTKSATFVGLTTLAQLGPALLLAMVGGVLADTFDRRRLIVIWQLEQIVATIALAVVAAQDDVNQTALLLAVLAGGIGFSLNSPAQTALMPTLVDRKHLAGAVSLNSAQMNGSRVVGMLLGGILYPAFGAAAVFGINAATYVFLIVGVLSIDPPRFVPVSDGTTARQRLKEGLRYARHDRTARRVLVTIATFSLLCLPFLGQMPTIAEENLGMDTETFTYGAFYATFAFGALFGALAIGTYLSRRDLRHVSQVAMGVFAVLMLVWAVLSDTVPAFVVVALVGFAYFATITSLATVLQTELDDAIRGRVFSIWQTGFAGTVPVGVMLAGLVGELTSMRFVLAYGAVVAGLLTFYVRGLREQ